MKAPSVAHGTFTVERRYDASPARVFRAYSEPAAFRRWFVDGEGWTIHEWEHDFRVGGRAGGRFRLGDKGNETWFNDTDYLDIAPDQRIVCSYVMGREVDGQKQRASASLGTTELVADGSGTRLIYTEQGAFFDGADDIRMREQGCAELLDALGRELDATR
ncbi:MAG: SRPBCC family protein [Brevundimonas sp.]|uniref:SRPBCC family protein n=1 Tax=Brevundimonas sp. TaxID=1871086 RepID=UPI002489E212|nr:SRPBCC family protein [Brevundimonas sp.]MDI1327942.1 SRPBCC family protein [Brevundimonas sp.]